MATKLYPDTANGESAGLASLSTDSDDPLQTTLRAGISAITASTTTGPASVQFVDGTAKPVSFWFEVAAVTISGTITFNLWALESSMSANAGLRVVIDRCDSTGAFISTIVDSSKGTELGTAIAVQNWTASPTSTTMAAGDYLRVRIYITDAGGTLTTGFTATFDNGGTAAADGDSWVQFTETIVAGTPPVTSKGPVVVAPSRAAQQAAQW